MNSDPHTSIFNVRCVLFGSVEVNTRDALR